MNYKKLSKIIDNNLRDTSSPFKDDFIIKRFVKDFGDKISEDEVSEAFKEALEEKMWATDEFRIEQLQEKLKDKLSNKEVKNAWEKGTEDYRIAFHNWFVAGEKTGNSIKKVRGWEELREEILNSKKGEVLYVPGGEITIYGKNRKTGEFEFGFGSENSGTTDLCTIEYSDTHPESARAFLKYVK